MTRKLGSECRVSPENAAPLAQEDHIEVIIDKAPDAAEAGNRLLPPEVVLVVDSCSSSGEEAACDEIPTSTGSSKDYATGIGSGVEVVVIPAHDSENVTSTDDRGMFKPCAVLPPDAAAAAAAALVRCHSTFSTDSFADCCRICQHHGDEPLMELGCHCRGELAKAHRSCIQQWFGNKGSNKCEICQHIAENVPAPPAQSAPHFWVWRLGVNRGSSSYTQGRSGRRGRFHPLWAALLILIAGLLFDVLISIFLGASALPVNIIIGVLVVLGIGTAARLVVECWHERSLRRNIRRIETNLAHLQEEFQVSSNNAIQGQPIFTAPARPVT